MTRKPRRAELDVTLDEYEALLAAQGGVCALFGYAPRTRRLDVDHDHRSGSVRGLLSQRANRAIPSERLLPAGWDLESFGIALQHYAAGVPFGSDDFATFRRTLDEINSRREDGDRV